MGTYAPAFTVYSFASLGLASYPGVGGGGVEGREAW